jgi:7-cyano-7-deazaguanine synthase
MPGRHPVDKPDEGGTMPTERAVILVSGGVNSAVAAAIAREQYEPAWLHVAWGHRSGERERSAFQALAQSLKPSAVEVADLSCMAGFGGNARVSRRLSIEDAEALGRQVPGTFAAGLLPSMISVAASWAASLGSRRVILGLNADPQTGKPPLEQLYPDHRPEFVQACNLLLTYSMPADRAVQVEAPVMDLSRSEIVKLAHQLDVPLDQTWSCYADNKAPCQRCLGCANRMAGFLHAGVPDPLFVEAAASH